MISAERIFSSICFLISCSRIRNRTSVSQPSFLPYTDRNVSQYPGASLLAVGTKSAFGRFFRASFTMARSIGRVSRSFSSPPPIAMMVFIDNDLIYLLMTRKPIFIKNTRGSLDWGSNGIHLPITPKPRRHPLWILTDYDFDILKCISTPFPEDNSRA
jgi:hypothetical protein